MEELTLFNYNLSKKKEKANFAWAAFFAALWAVAKVVITIVTCICTVTTLVFTIKSYYKLHGNPTESDAMASGRFQFQMLNVEDATNTFKCPVGNVYYAYQFISATNNVSSCSFELYYKKSTDINYGTLKQQFSCSVGESSTSFPFATCEKATNYDVKLHRVTDVSSEIYFAFDWITK